MEVEGGQDYFDSQFDRAYIQLKKQGGSLSFLLYGQLMRTIMEGSSDDSNPGKVWVTDSGNQTREVVRTDHGRAYINSVNQTMKLCLVSTTPKKDLLEIRELFPKLTAKTREEADILFEKILLMLKKTSFFGAESLGVIWTRNPLPKPEVNKDVN